MEVDELRREVEAISWYHTIDLGHGVMTPGRNDTPAILDCLAMPKSLHGKTVLDVGTWDGFYAFEAERRGAARVLATDSFVWQEENWPTGKRGFELARRALDSRVEDLEVDVLELTPERVGVFDLVLLLGVLYHMRHPLLALERVASVAANQLIIETHVNLFEYQQPALAFYPNSDLRDDPTNWFGPNPAAVAAMLETVGFRRVEPVTPILPARRSRLRRSLRAWRSMRRNLLRRPPEDYRMVFHAWK